jgi:hypothetical protein
MAEVDSPSGANGGRDLSRREFVRTVGATALVASIPLTGPHVAFGAPAKPSVPSVAETPAARFFRALDDDQRRRICFPCEHPLRTRVQNNWAIVKPRIGDLTMEQQALCREIFKGLCSDEGQERFLRQMHEDYGGFENYHAALFGEPGTAQPFEWVLTGRHNTLRADGNRHEGAAFGGPIFYGHAANGRTPNHSDHAGNVWWYQAEQANAILQSLDGRQRIRAFLTARQEDAGTIPLEDTGLAVAELDAAQKQMVQQLLHDLIRPFRGFDAEEVQECLREPSGADRLRLTFYKDGNVGSDDSRDIWKLEGPAFAWHFHGSPHVHSWVNIARRVPSA